MQTIEIIKKIEEFAPPELAAVWDNSGWQIFLGNDTTKKILLALTPSLEVINQAIETNCDLVIAHHPMFFAKLDKINVTNNHHKAMIKAVQNGIQVYSAHTNLDKTKGGIADTIADLLKLSNKEVFEEFVVVGELEETLSLELFLTSLKKVLNIDKVKLINPLDLSEVKRVGICPGSGADFINKINNVDVYITGDVKYHSAVEVFDKIVIDAGHFETERLILPVLKKLLSNLDVEVIVAEEKEPWELF